MRNHSIKKAPKQRKLSRSQQIEVVKKEWEREADLVTNEQVILGYEDITTEAFLKIIPDQTLDTSKQSKMIELQERYKDLIEQHDFLWAEDKVVDAFNKIHAVIHVDQTYILTEKKNTLGGHDFSLESRQSFRTYYEDETIMCIDGIERSKADIWLKSPKRRKYRGICFDPKTIESRDGYYNIWKGFAKKPILGNCQKYWLHVRENICDGNEENYCYLRRWAAYVFQHPDSVHTAIVLCGSQGVGKNSFVDPLGLLLGSHYAPLSSISELTSNFNYHLKNAVLINANEALWGGNKKEIGTVKAMITEQNCLIEGKGKDRIVVRNFKHVILSSNEAWPVYLDSDDRRFFVLKVSEKHKEDHEYFKGIQDELRSGGYEALLYDLLHQDLANFDPRKMPLSFTSFSIKMLGVFSSDRYIYAVLCEGGFLLGNRPDNEWQVWQPELTKDFMYEDYKEWCQKSGEIAQSKELFCKAIKKLIPSVEEKRRGGEFRARCFIFPPLKKAQEEFSKEFKQKPEQIFDNYEELE